MAKQEHQKAYDAAAALAEANPDNDGNEVRSVVLPQTIAYHASPLIAHHPLAYSSYVAAPVALRTIVPSGFSYSVNTAPQFYPHARYVIAA